MGAHSSLQGKVSLIPRPLPFSLVCNLIWRQKSCFYICLLYWTQTKNKNQTRLTETLHQTVFSTREWWSLGHLAAVSMASIVEWVGAVTSVPRLREISLDLGNLILYCHINWWCHRNYKQLNQWHSEGWAWPDTCPAKAPWASIQQVSLQYQWPGYTTELNRCKTST